jgi:hypothetical protein
MLCHVCTSVSKFICHIKILIRREEVGVYKTGGDGPLERSKEHEVKIVHEK